MSTKENCEEPSHPVSPPKTVYIDDSTGGIGSDSNGDGTREKPFLTEGRAIQSLPSGSGIVRDLKSRLVYCQ